MPHSHCSINIYVISWSGVRWRGGDVSQAERQDPSYSVRKRHDQNLANVQITNTSRYSALRGSASGPSSNTDSLVANHRVAEVALPLPLPAQCCSNLLGTSLARGIVGLLGGPDAELRRGVAGRRISFQDDGEWSLVHPSPSAVIRCSLACGWRRQAATCLIGPFSA